MKGAARKAKVAKQFIRLLDSNARNTLLLKLAHHLRLKEDEILRAQALDSQANPDEILTSEDIEEMALMVEEMAMNDEVIGPADHLLSLKNSNCKIQRFRVPVGVILVILKKDVRVMIEAVALALKTANTLILKSQAQENFTHKILSQVVRDVMNEELPLETIQVIHGESLEELDELLKSHWIDLVIPTGDEKLVNHVLEYAKMRSLVQRRTHLNHVFIDKSAKREDVVNIVLSNHLKTIFIHQDITEIFGPNIFHLLKNHQRKVKANTLFYVLAKIPIDECGYDEEDLKIKVVGSIDEVLETFEDFVIWQPQGIISQDQENIQKFVIESDAHCVMVNLSTLPVSGLGVSAEELTCYREVVIKRQRNDDNFRNETNLV